VTRTAHAALLGLAGALLLSGAAEARIHRDRAVIREFKRLNICPATGTFTQRCKGWEVDHRLPLCAAGEDVLANLQYISIADHRAKTRLDLKGCKLLQHATESLIFRD
jgi:hypothetical protein